MQRKLLGSRLAVPPCGHGAVGRRSRREVDDVQKHVVGLILSQMLHQRVQELCKPERASTPFKKYRQAAMVLPIVPEQKKSCACPGGDRNDDIRPRYPKTSAAYRFLQVQREGRQGIHFQAPFGAVHALQLKVDHEAPLRSNAPLPCHRYSLPSCPASRPSLRPPHFSYATPSPCIPFLGLLFPSGHYCVLAREHYSSAAFPAGEPSDI